MCSANSSTRAHIWRSRTPPEIRVQSGKEATKAAAIRAALITAMTAMLHMGTLFGWVASGFNLA